jgi:hypothetical protein
VTLKVGHRLFHPQAFLGVDHVSVAALGRALGELGASEKPMFWLREHDTFSGTSVAAAWARRLACRFGGLLPVASSVCFDRPGSTSTSTSTVASHTAADNPSTHTDKRPASGHADVA